MEKVNFALITALYDNVETDLYQEIYFPIIKYAVALLFQKSNTKYFTIDDVKSEIHTVFKIKIPLVVLKKAVRAISNTHSEVVISLFNGGNQFKIKQAWNTKYTNSIVDKFTKTERDIELLNKEFNMFMVSQNVETQYDFTAFFHNNCFEILGYIDNLDSAPIINENYVQLVNFIKILKERSSELYNVVINVFWSSIISAFLTREKEWDIKAVDTVYYYFDTSLVLALLDLDTEIQREYSRELLNLILNSGYIAKVHPITLKEVDNILNSIEQQGEANPFTSISEAYFRRELSPSKILKIRRNTQKILEKLGIHIEVTPNETVEDIVQKYETKSITNRLKKHRNNNNIKNGFREIHDVFMHDFILKKRGVVSVREKVNSYFVSINTDLIHFIKVNYPNVINTMIDPSKVVSTLWISNAKCSNMKEKVLTEVVSRCMVMNDIDVSQKLKIVSRFLSQEDITQNKEEYQEMCNGLTKRSNRYIEKIEELSLIDQSTDLSNDEKKESGKKVLANIIATASLDIKENLKKHNEHIAQVKQEIESENSTKISELKDKYESKLSIASTQVENSKNIALKIVATNKDIRGLEDKRILKRDALFELESQKSALEQSNADLLNCKISYICVYGLAVIEFVLLLLVLLLLLYGVYNTYLGIGICTFIKQYLWQIIITVLAAVSGLWHDKSFLININSRKKKKKSKIQDDIKNKNSLYLSNIGNIEKLEDEIVAYNDEINNLANGIDVLKSRLVKLEEDLKK